MAEINQTKSDKTAEIEKLAAKIASSSANSAKLKEEVATLQAELAELVREQAEIDKIRAEEKGAFEVNSAEMEKGLKVSRWHSRCSMTNTQRQTKPTAPRMVPVVASLVCLKSASLTSPRALQR